MTTWISCKKCGADLVKEEDEVCFICGTPVKGKEDEDNNEEDND